MFADRPDLAKAFFAELKTPRKIRFVEGMSAGAQLCAMSRCRENVITNSTFAWWGVWLNDHPDRTVIAPADWCRAGVPRQIDGIVPATWTQISGTLPFVDHFQVWRLRHPVATCRRMVGRLRGKVTARKLLRPVGASLRRRASVPGARERHGRP